MIANCKAYASTAGVESICEAMYLGKPILMVSEHIGHDCNAYEAVQMGAGIVEDSFRLDKLLEFAKSYQPNDQFVIWVKTSERRIMNEIEEVIEHHFYADTPRYSNCMPV